MAFPLRAMSITRKSGSIPRTVSTIPLGLASERAVKPELLIVEKLPASELLVRMAKVSPTFGLNPPTRLTSRPWPQAIDRAGGASISPSFRAPAKPLAARARHDPARVLL